MVPRQPSLIGSRRVVWLTLWCQVARPRLPRETSDYCVLQIARRPSKAERNGCIHGAPTSSLKAISKDSWIFLIRINVSFILMNLPSWRRRIFVLERTWKEGSCPQLFMSHILIIAISEESGTAFMIHSFYVSPSCVIQRMQLWFSRKTEEKDF